MYKIEITTNKNHTKIRTTDSRLEAVCIFWAARSSNLELVMRNSKHRFKVTLLDDDNNIIDKYEYKGEYKNDN